MLATKFITLSEKMLRTELVVTGSSPGRDGVVVDHECIIMTSGKHSIASMNVKSKDCDTPELSLDNLALHLELMAKAIRSRQEPRTLISVYEE